MRTNWVWIPALAFYGSGYGSAFVFITAGINPFADVPLLLWVVMTVAGAIAAVAGFIAAFGVARVAVGPTGATWAGLAAALVVALLAARWSLSLLPGGPA